MTITDEKVAVFVLVVLVAMGAFLIGVSSGEYNVSKDLRHDCELMSDGNQTHFWYECDAPTIERYINTI